jgi:hypothetical protein
MRSRDAWDTDEPGVHEAVAVLPVEAWMRCDARRVGLQRRSGGEDGPLYTGPVTVKGDDHYGLDGNGDGEACEQS